MNKITREIVENAVLDKSEDFIEELGELYQDIGISNDEDSCVEVNNLVIRLMIKELKGYKIISG